MGDQLEAVCVRHMEWCEARRLSLNTCRNRRYVLARLARWAEAKGVPLLYLTQDHLRRWQFERGRQLSSSALRAEIIHVQEFFRWTCAPGVGLLREDPSRALEKPRAQRRLPRPISETEFRVLLAAADPETKVILCLSGFAGLRAAEIASLVWSEVDVPSKTLRVLGKGDKERVVPLSAPVVEALSALRHRSGPVVRRKDGGNGQTTGNLVSMRASAHGRMLGVEFRLHQLRHRFATMALDATGDLRVVQELLGHSSPAVTAVYTKVRQGKLRTAVDAAAALGEAAAS